MLEAKALTLIKSGRCLLDKVNLTLRRGEFIAVLGPNGAGKSTLMHCLSGAERGTGEVTMDHRCPSTISAAELAIKRAVLEQAPRVSAPFSVDALVRLGVPRELTASATDEVSERAIELLDLGTLRRRPVLSLSGGEQHRTQMARVMAQLWAGQLLGGGRYLLIDEPTASLDLHHQITVLKAARQAALEGVGVLAILHDLSLAASVADRLLLLKQGRVVADGTPHETLTRERLSELYGLPVMVHESEGTLTVTPHYAACWSDT
ncbi:hypothetical protein C1H69_02185 [Billgrantia endophytica]|uniref:ABC transporter domain-containing protein n=1 Tax=Billgrantia endophytica TaxID=2033802 RepID=A0A2N7UA97_9GAMM|nr:ATP-binding cassette domain-containing protein [Halomonas endophytica]PMR77367.1 hypothetical protein C1H69_02185 [Halomonas endophytica]